MNKNIYSLFISLFVAIILTLLTWWVSGIAFLSLIASIFIISFLGVICLLSLFHKVGGGQKLAWIIILAFIFRLGIAYYSSAALPNVGYDEAPQNSGYLFRDAYNRDTQAWLLAKSDLPIWNAFGSQFISDQYGGLLALSATMYKIFSPAVHLKYLILLLAVFLSTIGVLFVWKIPIGNSRASLYAALLYAFFPDAVLFSSSEMREPFLLGLSAILFWLATSHFYSKAKRISLGFIISTTIMVISAKVGVFIIICAILWVIVENIQAQMNGVSPFLVLAAGGLFFLLFAVFSLNWIIDASKWDAIVAVQSSGWLQALFKKIPDALHIPFLTIYGLLQPILPAALVEPSISFWKVINIYRALGWALLAPGIVYSFIFVVKQPKIDRRKWAAILLMISFWILLSSLRAGGDLWDNPRYRLALFVPMVCLVGKALDYGFRKKDLWIARILISELIFDLFFLQWYISRYTNLFGKLDFLIMISLIIFCVGLVIVQGIWYDWHHRPQTKLKDFIEN